MKRDTIEIAGHKPKTVEIIIEDTVCGVCQRALDDGVEGACSCQLVDESEEEVQE